jgi:thiamine-monophosphate kinase
MSDRQVRDIGEQGLLQRLQQFCPGEMVGDDAALLSVKADHLLVVTTDVLVDQVHFSDHTTSPQDVGWRAAAANLSDLAAMGATPLGITVGLSLPGDLSVAWVEELYQGLTACLNQYNTPIVGGDICRSPLTTVGITAFGQVHPAHAIRRSTAQVGDVIVVTGVHGSSRAGLELLLHPELGKDLSEGDRTTLITAHQRPKPRLDLIPLLYTLTSLQNSKFKIQNSRFTSSSTPNTQHPTSLTGMDSSDGLADAIVQICRASRVGAVIDRRQISIAPALRSWMPEKAMEWALYGGEDFELVLCLPPEAAHALLPQLGEDAAIIGTITSESAVVVHDPIGQHPDEILSLDRGFQHF